MGLWDRVNKMFCRYWSVADLIANLQIMLLVVFGAVFAIRGELSAGAYIAFLSYNGYLTWPIRQLGRVISEMSKAGVSLRRIEGILNAAPERDEDGAERVTTDYRGDIAFDRVSFSFDGKTPVLEDVSFTVPAGSTVGILGGTGSGKSTLVRLLDRLYPLPEGSGTISVGGIDIRRLRAAELRSNIGFVLQEPYLFSRTIGENLRLAKQTASDAELRAAAHIACLDRAPFTPPPFTPPTPGPPEAFPETTPPLPDVPCPPPPLLPPELPSLSDDGFVASGTRLTWHFTGSEVTVRTASPSLTFSWIFSHMGRFPMLYLKTI